MPTKSTANTNSPRQRALYLDPKLQKAAIAKIRLHPTTDIKTAACGLGIGLGVAYREAERLGAHRIGGRWVFSGPKLCEMIGIASQIAA